MYKEIGEYTFMFAMLMGMSVIAHFIFNMGKIIYRGLIELDKVPVVVMIGIFTIVIMAAATFISMMVFAVLWPVAIMLCIVSCLHPQVRCRILDGKSIGLQIVLFPVMITLSLHIFLTELATFTAYNPMVDIREV